MSQMCVKREMKRLRHKVIGDNEFNLCYAVLGDRAGARVLALALRFYGNNRKYHLDMFPWGRVCFQGPQEGGVKEPTDLSLVKDARRFSDEQSIIPVYFLQLDLCFPIQWPRRALNLTVILRNAVKNPLTLITLVTCLTQSPNEQIFSFSSYKADKWVVICYCSRHRDFKGCWSG